MEAEQASRLRDAQRSFALCVKATCEARIRHECRLRHDQLAEDIPSVVPLLTDAAGAPLLEVTVTMDGEVLTSQIDGRAVTVDPGLHRFTFSSAGGVVTRKIVILQGQRNRLISISLGDASAPARKTRPPSLAHSPATAAHASADQATALWRPSDAQVSDKPSSTGSRSGGKSPAAYAVSALGLVGVGGYALLTYWGRRDNQMLVQCAPRCMKRSVDHVRTLYLAANISLGAGMAALGAATWLFWRSARLTKAVTGSGYALDVLPLAAGAVASLRGAF